MRVICIKVDKRNDCGIDNLPHPTLGETVTVIGEDAKYGFKFYQFDEYPFFQDKALWYNVKNYMPVSDLDETELVSEEFKEKYLVPVK